LSLMCVVLRCHALVRVGRRASTHLTESSDALEYSRLSRTGQDRGPSPDAAALEIFQDENEQAGSGERPGRRKNLRTR
jgi:hypothetical protein